MHKRNFGMLAVLASALTMNIFTLPALSPRPPKIRSVQRKRRKTAPKSWGRVSHLNRSRHWPYAATYKEARRISPYPDRPVR